MTEPLTRQEIIDQREAYSYSSDHVVMADTALHYEARSQELGDLLTGCENRLREVEESRSTIMRDLTARCRELEAERDRLQEWTDRVALASTDAATAAEKAEARVAELEEAANAVLANPWKHIPERDLHALRAALRKETL